MFNNLISIFILLFSIVYSFDTVKKIDLDRFMGKWYVISAIPNFIEKGCSETYDLYKLNKDKTISVEYHAIKNGSPFIIKQEATIIDTINNSKWEMRFIDPWVPFYSAPYEVIVLDTLNYEYMVVGYPGNDYGWIMSRNSYMSDSLYLELLLKLKLEFNYDENKFIKIQHTYSKIIK